MNLPASIVVDANGCYWRNFGQYFSKCPTSSDNDPIEIVAVYDWAELGRESSAADVDGASEADKAAPGHHESVGERQGRQPAPHLPDPQPSAPEASEDCVRDWFATDPRADTDSGSWDYWNDALSAFDALVARLAETEARLEAAEAECGRLQKVIAAKNDLLTAYRIGSQPKANAALRKLEALAGKDAG